MVLSIDKLLLVVCLYMFLLLGLLLCISFFFSSRRRHTRYWRDWSSDVCSSDLLKAILALCFAALMLVGCSEEPDEPDRGHNGAVSAGGAAEAAKTRTMAEEGILGSGRYSTGVEFKPLFSFELVGEGWRALPAPGPYSYKLGYLTPGRKVAEGKALRFLNARKVYQPREEDDEVSFESKPEIGRAHV